MSHGHDVLHQCGWNSCGKVSDQNVGVRDVGEGDMVSEHRDIFHERGGVQVVLVLLHVLGR